MKNALEIERKFLLSTLPDISGIAPIEYERYFIERGNRTETRVQKKGNKYTYEKKIEKEGVGRERAEEREISEEEFNTLKKNASKAILRTRYDISPLITIQVYHADYEGLIRYEVEFNTVAEAQAFVPESWLGKEITDSLLGRDGKLLDLSREEFLLELKKFL